MDHRTIEENNVIERYVLGRLPVEEQVRFEEHFAECPECVEQLELAADFDHALRAAVAQDAGQAGLAVAAGRWLLRRRATLALAVMLLVAVAPSLWLVSENRRLAGDLASLRQPHASGATQLLTLTRDSGPGTTESTIALPTLVAPSGTPWLTVSVETPPALPGEEIAGFGVVVTDAAGQEVWRGEDLETTPWGILQVTFPRELLPAGDYRLDLTAHHADGRSEPLASLSFRVAPP